MTHFSKKKKMPLVYFVCPESDRLFVYADILRNNGYEVQFFEQHLDALECSINSTVPSLIVTTPFATTIDTWQFVRLLKSAARETGITIPVLILSRMNTDAYTLSTCTQLTSQNVMFYPVETEPFLERISLLMKQAETQTRQSVLLIDSEGYISKQCVSFLDQSGFDVRLMADTSDLTGRIPAEAFSIILISAVKPDRQSKRKFLSAKKIAPDIPIGIITPNNTYKETRDWLTAGVSVVIPVPADPVELIIACHNATTRHLFRHWFFQTSLQSREYEDRERLFRRVVESQNDLLCKWLPDTTLTFVNDAFCRMLKTTRKNLVGTLFSQLVIPDGNVSVTKMTQEILQSGECRTFEHGFIENIENARWHHWTCSPISSDDGILREVLAVGRDISTLKKLEWSLESKNAELESLLDSFPNHFWYLSDPDTFRASNRIHAEFLGKSQTDLVNCPVKSVYSKDDLEFWRNTSQQVISSGNPVTVERSMISGNGENRVLSVTETPCFDEKGKIRFIVCSGIDVTDERNKEFNIAFRAEFEHLISEISSDFVQHDIRDIDSVILNSLAKISQFTGIDRATVHFIEEWTSNGHSTFVWPSQPSEERSHENLLECSWFLNQLSESLPVYLTDTATLPPEATGEKTYIEKNHIQSLLIVPLESQKKLAGYISFESFRSPVSWETEIRTLLRLYGELLLNTVVKTQAWNFIQSERDFGNAVNLADSLDDLLTICLDYAIGVSGLDAGGIYLADDSSGSLQLIKHKNLHADFVSQLGTVPPDSPLFRNIIAGQSYFVSYIEMQTTQRKTLLDQGFKSFSVLPVVYEGNVIACFNLASYKKEHVTDFARHTLETVISRFGPVIAKGRIEDAIRRHMQNLDTLFNSMKDCLFVVNDAGQIMHVNKACMAVLGYSENDLMQRSLFECYEESSRNSFESCLKSNMSHSPSDSIQYLIAADGMAVPVEVRIVRGEWKQKQACFVFNHDLRELQELENQRFELERQIQQAQKVESLSRMAGAIAHRFNNLLMGITGNLELAKMQVAPDSRVMDKLKQAEGAAQRATDLGRLMLTYVGQVGTNRVECNLSDVADRLMPLLQASVPSGVRFETEFTRELPLINADVGGLHQILMNLTSNAWESFGESGGWIHLETGVIDITDAFDEVLVENERLIPGRYVYFSITDNGCGMDSATVDRMFDPFFTTKFTGRGLGLSTVLGIVRAHEGGISVISEKGISTRITIYFPALQKSTVHRPGWVDQTAAPVDLKKTILLADDEEDVREVARQMLENMGYAVLQAEDGKKAVELFGKHRYLIKCLICDVNMPELDGWETMTAIRRIQPDVPVILVTGYGLTAAEIEKHPKPDGYIQKPYRFQTLMTLLDQIGHPSTD